MADIVTFGELLLRLSSPGYERLFQSPALQTHFGGAEANVAVSLARFGHRSRVVSRVPEQAIGDAAVRALRAEGVETGQVLRGGERLGLYYAETGASQRPGTVIYDRAGSALAELDAATIDWPAVLDGADWLHVTGITPALGDGPRQATANALAAARAAGIRTSFDPNYRQKLWTSEAARSVLQPMMRWVDVVIANGEDLRERLGVDGPQVTTSEGRFDPDACRRLASRTHERYGCQWVAVTVRDGGSASEQGWRAALYRGEDDAFYLSPRAAIHLVDRIGGGDAFAAGLIHGLLTLDDPAKALRFAVAASILQQTIPGDFNRVSAGEVTRLAEGGDGGRVRR